MFKTSSVSKLKHGAVLIIALLALAGCETADKLSKVGQEPELTAIQDPRSQPGYRPVQMPMPMKETERYNANSLWRTGNRAFFQDQRAKRIGDIVTVKVTISDKAAFANTSRSARSDAKDAGAGGAIGTAIDEFILPSGTSADALASISSSDTFQGSGSIDRTESLETTVAAVVTQVLPNSNLVIEGRQEVRVNHEVRELIVAGVVRPQDIASDNTVESTKIAEARIGYGGRGQLSIAQQPRYGSQVLDIILPF
ncbi:Flagellar L-ring protein precursor [Pseudovibrio axinellae]|uniref:Flagellar L-ring protein n=1 Tax=Pseudovibrio axinellae TaxID=989403 RepID=A0A166ANM3_9HYPH|nr:flagellar basal body L-ring protein FlgH [Pseudovibrio axinellae]KZL21352.1 Flagellar L-ring protein precursor [Pseudovibrio axinellae]SEQ97171.1 flagellar L-ring protein precursor FlgH [Pseudovibrio axinellae]